MAWRGVHLSRSAQLCLENRCLRIDFRDDDGGTFRIPLEDLSYVIVDTVETSLSARLLTAMAEHSVLVLGVDSRHLPVWVSMPWASHYKHGPVIELQTQSSVPLRKQIWAHIVQQKIEGQARTLAALGRQGTSKLRMLVSRVRSGDADNTEARAARLYWEAIFANREFLRHDDDLPNALLNYGYALVRAALARNLCAYGFIPQLGVFHSSATNAFNLADDLIEPYRPIVDFHVIEILGDTKSSEPFEKDHRRALAQMLESKVYLEEEMFSLIAATEHTVNAFRSALENKNPHSLVFPRIPPL